MEQNPDTRSPGSKGLALVGVSLALVGASKTGQHQDSVEPLVKDYHEMSFAQGDQTEGLLAYASNSSTGTPASLTIGHDLHPHHSLHKYCATITRNMGPTEKVQYGTFKFFMKKGLTPVQAAGIDGNFGQESTWNPSDSGGYLAQWGGERLSALESYAKRLGKAVTSPIVQFKYTWQELTHGYRNVLKDLKNSKTVEDATTVFNNGFEKPGDAQLQTRIYYAEHDLHKFGHMACINANHTGVKARIAVPQHNSTS